MEGPLIILSGPSGSGKSTVIARLLAVSGLPLRQSVSVTTRAPRPGEKDGIHYHFWTRERFQEAARAGAFLESAVVNGQCYGTPRSEVESYRAQGVGVILVIDVQGAAQVRQLYPDCLSVFLLASDPAEYEKRLRRRGEMEASIAQRLATARRELGRKGEYDYEVTNDDLERAVAELTNLIAPLFRGKKEG